MKKERDQNRRIERGSHTLSRILRHAAREARLDMDEAGWAPIAQVLAASRLTADELMDVVRQNNKSRLEVRGDRIRACQGHSLSGMPVTQDALEASWEPFVGNEPIYHGTRLDVLPAIARDGITPGRRTHVHLAPATESRVGKRANVAVLLAIDPARLRASGRGIFVSPNGVVLTRDVPSDCITGTLPISREARARAAALQALFGHA